MTTTVTPAPALFNPDHAAPGQRLALGHLAAACFAFAYPDDPPQLPDKIALGLGLITPGERTEHVVIWENDLCEQGVRALVWGRLDYSLDQNRQLAHVTLLVHPQARRRGLGRAVFGALEQRARQAGHTTLTCITTDRAPAGEPFARHFGAAPALTNRRSQLMLDQISNGLLDHWLTRLAGDPYRLHLWSTLPETYLERLAELTMVMNSAPRGELEFDDWTITPEMLRAWETQLVEEGDVRWTAVIENLRSGQLVGYSEIYWTPLRAAVVNQGATAVRIEARSLGLGKWLKAALLRQIVAECPDAQYVRTSNAHENAAMLGINTALGFAPWAETTEWQLKLSPLA